MFKKIKNWFETIDAFAFFTQIFIVTMFAVILFIVPYSVYKETVTHYDIHIEYVNGEQQVIHCDFYGKKRNYLYYDTADNNWCYINFDNILSYSVVSVECNCFNT